MPLIKSTLHKLFRILPLWVQRLIIWCTSYKFTVGVAGIVFDPNGRVLLQQHVFRKTLYWELPCGGVSYRETIFQAMAREINEEVAIEADITELVSVESGYKLHVEFIVAGHTLATEKDLQPNFEVFSARFFATDALPTNLRKSHRHYILHAASCFAAEQAETYSI